MRYRIKARLAELGRTQVDVISELKKRGIVVSDSNFSRALNNRWQSQTADLICEEADRIISEWEAMAGLKK